MDLHLHTPASNDYQEPATSYLDILRQAEIRGLDIIAFTDHNSYYGLKIWIGYALTKNDFWMNTGGS